MLGVDDLVGAVVKALKETKRYQNTVLVFTSDNGMAWGDHRAFGKTNPWSTHVPLYATWPKARGTTKRSEPTYVTNIDWRATIADLAATSPAASDGRSFAPLLRDQPVDLGRSVLLEDQPGPTAERTWRGLRSTYDAPIGAGWRYLEAADGWRGLYRTGTGVCWKPSTHDPCLLRNLIDDPAHAAQQAWFEAREERVFIQRLRTRPGDHSDALT